MGGRVSGENSALSFAAMKGLVSCIMKQLPAYLSTKARVKWVLAHHATTFPPTPPHTHSLERHNKSEGMLPSKDLAEQWECKTNLQAVGFCGEGPGWAWCKVRP